MDAQREWFEKDYYAVLGVGADASQKELTKAYRRLARENHPDTNKGDAAAEERFKEISAAYDVVGDTDKRAKYDEVRRLGAVGGGFGPGGAGGPGGFGGGFGAGAEGVDLGDLLGNLFGGRGRRNQGRSAGPERGVNLETELHLAFEDALAGVTTSVHLVSDAVCSTCHGSGAEPGSDVVVCPQCAGRGVIDENQGLFSFSQPCPRCAGQGMVVSDPCHTCAGSGIERRPRTVKVKIPAGVTDGQRIKVKGRGGPGRNGGPPGDLYVVVHVGRHSLFGRKGRNLTLSVPITFTEAALGADIKVPTLAGEPVTIRIPAGTTSGRTFKVKGKGAVTDAGKGDLLVTVEVAVPQKLSADERTAVEALAEATTESPRAHLGV
ncbi:MAG TPA: molecular chaperone DnaJ [Acidimicrobiales bacterium]